MATKYPSASGNYSTRTWLDAPAGSVTTAPGVSDKVDLNSTTLTLDQDVTLVSIIGAGTLTINATRTVNANLGEAGSAFSCSLTGAITITINGNILADITNNRLSITGALTVVNITGGVTGGNAANIKGINHTNGTLTITGNVTAGTATSAMGVQVSTNAGANCTINGSLFGSSTNNASTPAMQLAIGTLTINGNVNGGSGTGTGAGAGCLGLIQISGTLNITGSLVDHATGSSAFTRVGGTTNYTPTSAQTATIGGKVLYPYLPAIFVSNLIRRDRPIAHRRPLIKLLPQSPPPIIIATRKIRDRPATPGRQVVKLLPQPSPPIFLARRSRDRVTPGGRQVVKLLPQPGATLIATRSRTVRTSTPGRQVVALLPQSDVAVIHRPARRIVIRESSRPPAIRAMVQVIQQVTQTVLVSSKKFVR